VEDEPDLHCAFCDRVIVDRPNMKVAMVPQTGTAMLFHGACLDTLHSRAYDVKGWSDDG
jgi:hypothetical protein